MVSKFVDTIASMHVFNRRCGNETCVAWWMRWGLLLRWSYQLLNLRICGFQRWSWAYSKKTFMHKSRWTLKLGTVCWRKRLSKYEQIGGINTQGSGHSPKFGLYLLWGSLVWQMTLESTFVGVHCYPLGSLLFAILERLVGLDATQFLPIAQCY